mmetsp:Transcript_125612/g.349807  ORF Transcript_125612/g.349807 Transcript_125612/m.349807 type:complete len:122 (-) Transcript_125612:92-457(-)
MLNVFYHSMRRAFLVGPRVAGSDLRRWILAATTTYLTIAALLVCDLAKLLRYAADVTILWYLWMALGDRQQMLFQLALWLFSAWVKRVLETWSKAMMPRLPFLNVRLERKYTAWLAQTKQQ